MASIIDTIKGWLKTPDEREPENIYQAAGQSRQAHNDAAEARAETDDSDSGSDD